MGFVHGATAKCHHKCNDRTSWHIRISAIGANRSTVVLFSTDRQQWGVASRFVASSTVTRSDGLFTIRNLPSGEYYAAAVPSLASEAWRDPALLESLISTAMHVSLNPGTTQISLRITPR